jgi:hypothetical protein
MCCFLTLPHTSTTPPPIAKLFTVKGLKSLYLDIAVVARLWVGIILYKNFLYLEGRNKIENSGYAMKSCGVTDFSVFRLPRSWYQHFASGVLYIVIFYILVCIIYFSNNLWC